ncbi:MAG TPA: GNAT family N-acetyltransferase [Clostridiaceae bacterium]|nr:GNAT family N-acetyltransferase [Clostridiaceae bacterium]
MFKIDYAELSDAEILGEIHAASWKEAYKEIIPHEVLRKFTAEKREEYFYKAIIEKRGQNAVIYKDDTPAGLICIGKCRDEDRYDTYGEIWGIYLKPEFWNMGIGYELMTWGIEELKKQGYSKVTLWVLKDNHGARRFYEKYGFFPDGTEKEIHVGKVLKELRYEMSIPCAPE